MNIINRNSIIFYLILIVLIVWHLISINISPLPWFDETVFASVTRSFLINHNFNLSICPLLTKNQILAYGPVYFLLTSLNCKIFGFGLFQIRIINLLFAGFSVIIITKIQKLLLIRSVYIKYTFLLLIFDVIFIQNAHSGRMDLVALFFGLIPYYIYFKNSKNKFDIFLFAFSSIIALLTTPRILIIILPVNLFFFYQLFITKKWNQIITILVIQISLFLSWVITEFGTIVSFFNYYTKTKFDLGSTSNNLTTFIGGNFYFPFYQLPIILLGLFSLILLIRNGFKNNHFYLLYFPIVLFYLLVKDTGIYSAMIIPFWYLVIILSFETITYSSNILNVKLIYKYLLILIFIINFSIFLIKVTSVLNSVSVRNPINLDNWVHNNIPEGSKVIGEDRYYYACIKNNCDFQYIVRPFSLQERIKYHYESFKPDYIFISLQTPKDIINSYKNTFMIDTIYYYNPVIKKNKFSTLINKYFGNVASSYAGILYRISYFKGKKV